MQKNFMSFISSIFSSAYKKKNQIDTDKDSSSLTSKSQTYQQEENLLANLRKSKLFLDDSDIGLQSKTSPMNIQSFKENPNLQAQQEAEKVVGLMISSSKKLSKSQMSKEQLGEIAEIVPQLRQSSLKKEQQLSMNNQQYINGQENSQNSQIKDILLRSDTRLDAQEAQSSKNKMADVNQFTHDQVYNNRNSSSLHQNTLKNDNQSCYLRNSFCQIDSKVIDNSNIPGLGSNMRRCTEASQKLMSAFTFNEEALPALSLVYNSNPRISNQYHNDSSNSSHNLNSINQYQVNNNNSNLEIDLSQLKPSSLNDSFSSHLQVAPNQHQSITRGSSNSRVRGSSSKKKQIVSESPLSTKGKREIPSCSYDKYPMLEQIRENISNIVRYQPLVKEDIEGENEGAAAPATQEQEYFNSQKKKMEEDGRDREEKLNILNLSAAPNSRTNNFFQLSNSKQFDCLSNKAEPPTQMKQRSNSFFFEQSDDKKKIFNLDEIGSKGSNTSSKSSSKYSGDKKMQVESPFKDVFESKSALKGTSDQEINQSNHKELVSFSQHEQNNHEGNEHQNTSQEENDSRFHSQQKTKSNEQSPNKAHFNSFHKAVDMMIDKSEIPPPHLSRSAHKVPSPIKEVDELSQKNLKNTPKKNEMEVMENIEPKEENTNDFDGSPKMRQKSVKFDSFTPNGQEKEDEEQHKHNLKLQSRKPTPYNPFKSQPISYLSRHNKFKNEETLSQSSSDSNKDSSSQQNNQEIKPADSIVTHASTTEAEPKQEIKLRYPPIFKDQENSKSKNRQAQQSVSTEKVKEVKPIQNTNKQLSASPLIRTPIIQNTQKHPIKQQLALKKKETTQAIVNNNFFKVENTNSTPTVFHSNKSGSTNSSSSGQLNNTKNHQNIFSNKLNNSGNSNKTQNQKQKPQKDEQLSLNEFISAQRTKAHDEYSLPTPLAAPLRGTINSGSLAISQIKNAYKTCIFCQQEIKVRDEIKTFTCCHKAHKSCLPKEKNVKCLRCNSNAMVNKYRPKE